MGMLVALPWARSGRLGPGEQCETIVMLEDELAGARRVLPGRGRWDHLHARSRAFTGPLPMACGARRGLLKQQPAQ